MSGAVIGAAIISALKFWLTGFVPELWPFILAGVILLVVTLLPNGLLDLKLTFLPRASTRKASARPAE